LEEDRMITNPGNPKQARVFFSYMSAMIEHNETRHADIVMKEIADKNNFKIIGKVPQTLFDGWEYWIEFDKEPELPGFVRNINWEPL
jgi:hypothetical protein